MRSLNPHVTDGDYLDFAQTYTWYSLTQEVCRPPGSQTPPSSTEPVLSKATFSGKETDAMLKIFGSHPPKGQSQMLEKILY